MITKIKVVQGQRLRRTYLQPQLMPLKLAKALTRNLTQYLVPAQQNALEEATKWPPILLQNLPHRLKTPLQRLQFNLKLRRLLRYLGRVRARQRTAPRRQILS
jgi:hypothetical protein